ncbi:hypothetical protein lpari_00014 [Legionella parisiensis]|uniref:Uncharacterized protein n=1 Tax=Legionella parisiensis TaxID=45071 RepID=A0A1E5JWR9_9GAMM|nr:hypothetical protein lpari_00014 [Legionella parisiensis]
MEDGLAEFKKTEEMRVTLIDFLAVRLVLTCVLWPDAVNERQGIEDSSLVKKVLAKLKSNEDSYRQKLLSLILREVKKDRLILHVEVLSWFFALMFAPNHFVVLSSLWESMKRLALPDFLEFQCVLMSLIPIKIKSVVRSY